jgi:hypothetical protein
MIVRGLLMPILAATALLPSLGVAQYAPKWHVGDWWVTKTRHEDVSGDWVWDLTRYDIVRTEKVGQRDCFVLESHYQEPSGRLCEAKDVYSIRKDNWLVVRQVRFHVYRGTLHSATLERPLGMFGPFQAGEPRLPRFPLVPASKDTMFRLQVRDDFAADLREVSRIADAAQVQRLLDEGDTVSGRVVRTTGTVYLVRSEVGGNLDPGLPPCEKSIGQSLQLWSADQPWRVYEELVNYSGPDFTRYVLGRTWLVASGHGRN